MEDKELEALVEELQSLYEKDGEDLKAYLTGLKYQQYINYWEYINLNNLLDLQQPRSNQPDEVVFITYHQITELYFKLVLWELQQLKEKTSPDAEFWKTRLNRLLNYFRLLTQSFSVMKNGMDPDQFLRFRATLVPASGFQSVQYRMIELACTPLINLVKDDQYHAVKNEPIEVQLESIYWKQGAIDQETGRKTLTLSNFEEQYQDYLVTYAKEWEGSNLWERFQAMPAAIREDESIIKLMRQLDKTINVQWPKAHYNTAREYLEHGNKGTGGTNYHTYLPPSIQQRIFFPELWSEEEKAQWGQSQADNEA
jgi:tryptophan 2,3-dioxygenase